MGHSCFPVFGSGTSRPSRPEKKAIRPRISRILAFLAVAYLPSLATSWPDSAAGLLEGNQGRFLALLASHGSDGTLPADFVRLMSRFDASPRNRSVQAWLERAFAPYLRKQVHNASYPAFRTQAEDTAAPEAARAALLRILTAGEGGLGTAYKDSLVRLQRKLLNASSSPEGLKIQALIALGGNPSQTDPAPLLEQARSQNPRLRTAAYQALGQKIRYNRRAGYGASNHRIFDSLQTAAGESPDLNQVRAMAQISADYARDYLAVHCAGQPEKLAEVFRHDANPAHAGLLAAAAEVVEAGNTSLREVLQQEVAVPDTSLSANP